MGDGSGTASPRGQPKNRGGRKHGQEHRGLFRAWERGRLWALTLLAAEHGDYGVEEKAAWGSAFFLLWHASLQEGS